MSTTVDETPGRRLRTRTILIVDDNALITRVLKDRLTLAGFEVTAFNSGVQALRYAQGSPPDCALLDIHMGDFNGLILAQQLRRLMGERPIFILSGDTSMETVNSLPHSGATGFFAKPIESAKLVEQLVQWLARINAPSIEPAQAQPNPT